MARKFNHDDRGKPVLDYDGNRVGNVTGVRDGKGIIETDDDSSITDKIKSALDWDDNDDSHELRSEDIDSFNDDEVRLRNV